TAQIFQDYEIKTTEELEKDPEWGKLYFILFKLHELKALKERSG
ncbi:2126_t:CDS:1, partial [Gigaspora rosea]